MISRFFSKSGSPRDALNYLLDESKQPELMRGNPQNFEALASVLPFKNKYTSGVLRFNEKPDQPTLDAIMNQYSQFLNAGLNQAPEVLWVMHQEHGETELHFIVPNVDLESKRMFQPYLHRRDLVCRDALDDTINAQFGLTDPDDPANKRLVNSASNYLKTSKNRKELAQSIDNFVLNQAETALKNGFKYTSENAIRDIKSLGFEIKPSRGKLSITHSEMKKPIRLKGAFYEPNYSFSQSGANQIQKDSERYRASSGERFKTNAEKYKALLGQRASHVKAKYKRSWERVAERNKTHEQAQQPAVKNDTSTSLGYNHCVGAVVLPTNELDQKSSGRSREIKIDRERINSEYKTVPAAVRDKNSTRRDIRDSAVSQKTRLQIRSGHTEGLQDSIIRCFYQKKLMGLVVDKGQKLEAQGFRSDKSAAYNIVLEGKKKGWKAMQFHGNNKFLTHAYTFALKNGIKISTTDALQAQILEKVVEDDRIRNLALKTATDAIRRAEEFAVGVQKNNRKSGAFRQKIKGIDGAVKERKMNIDIAVKNRAWRNQSAALSAEKYRITLIGRREGLARGWVLGKGKGIDGAELMYSRDNVQQMISWLRSQNARGFDVYVTPIDPLYHYILIDDMKPGALDELKKNGYAPVLVQTSSKDNQQAIIKVTKVVRSDEQGLANRVTQSLNKKYGDKKLSGVVHPFRLAGFSNKKPGRNNFFTIVQESRSGQVCQQACADLQSYRDAVDHEAKKVSSATRTLNKKHRMSGDLDQSASDLYLSISKTLISSFRNSINPSVIDYRCAKHIIENGYTTEQARDAILQHSRGLMERHIDVDDYVNRTVQNAASNTKQAPVTREQKR